MAEDNIALAGVLLDAAILLQRPRYRECAARAVDYILDTLYDPIARGIRGSQGAHSDYFGQPAAARARRPAPPVDPYCYASLTAQGASLLFAAAWRLGRPELADIAGRLLDNLTAAAASGRNCPIPLPRMVLSPHPTAATCWWTGPPCSWPPWTGTIPFRRATDRCRNAAEAAADVLLERFLDGVRGGFYDIENSPARPGYLQAREKPLAENTAAAAGMMRLHHITGDSRYRQAARHTLSAYAEANRDYGELAADYAIAVDRFLNPVVEVTLEGQPGAPDAAAMLAAAMTLDCPNLLLKLALTAPETGHPVAGRATARPAPTSAWTPSATPRCRIRPPWPRHWPAATATAMI